MSDSDSVSSRSSARASSSYDDDTDAASSDSGWCTESSDDGVRETVPVPFWFGNEEPNHVQAIIGFYENELRDDITDPRVHRVRAPKNFIGRVKRTPVEADNVFTTLDEIVVFVRQSLSPSKRLPPEQVWRVLTSWDEDGMPFRLFKLNDKTQAIWEAKVSGEPSYLFSLPVLFSDTEQKFVVSPVARDVTEVDTWMSSDMVKEVRARYPVSPDWYDRSDVETASDDVDSGNAASNNGSRTQVADLSDPLSPHRNTVSTDEGSPNGNLAAGPDSPNFPPADGMSDTDWEQQQELERLFGVNAFSDLMGNMASLLASSELDGLKLDDDVSEFNMSFGIEGPDGQVTRVSISAQDSEDKPDTANFAIVSDDNPALNVTGSILEQDGNVTVNYDDPADTTTPSTSTNGSTTAPQESPSTPAQPATTPLVSGAQVSPTAV